MISKRFTTKVFIVYVTFVGIAIVHKIQATDRVTSDSSDEHSSNHQKISNEHPSLSCLLFHNRGCHSECSILAEAFDQEATGQCNNDQVCQCIKSEEGPIDLLFRIRIDTEEDQDGDGDEDEEEVEKSKKQISKKQDSFYKNITPVSSTQAAENPFTDTTQITEELLKDGQFDPEALQDFVDKRLPIVMFLFDRDLVNFKYEDQLLEALKHFQGDNFHRLVTDIRRTRNTSLQNILEQYLKDHDIREQEEENANVTVYDQIVDYVMNEFVKIVDQERSAVYNARKKIPIDLTSY